MTPQDENTSKPADLSVPTHASNLPNDDIPRISPNILLTNNNPIITVTIHPKATIKSIIKEIIHVIIFVPIMIVTTLIVVGGLELGVILSVTKIYDFLTQNEFVNKSTDFIQHFISNFFNNYGHILLGILNTFFLILFLYYCIKALKNIDFRRRIIKTSNIIELIKVNAILIGMFILLPIVVRILPNNHTIFIPIITSIFSLIFIFSLVLRIISNSLDNSFLFEYSLI